MHYNFKESGCPHCGNKKLEMKTEKNTKNILGKVAEWLKCCNENMLIKFYYKSRSKKMLREMPVFISKQWVCPNCGSKYNDSEELTEKVHTFEKMAAGLMVTWVVYNISVILVWNFAFHRQGLLILLLALLLGLLVVSFVHSGLRQTVLQKEYELGKMQCDIARCKQTEASFE